MQRRRAALHAHVVARAEAVARAGEEQRRADGYAALGAATFGLVECDGEAVAALSLSLLFCVCVCVCVIVVDRVVRSGGGGGAGGRRRRYDGGYVRGFVGEDDIDVDVVRRHRHRHPKERLDGVLPMGFGENRFARSMMNRRSGKWGKTQSDEERASEEKKPRVHGEPKSQIALSLPQSLPLLFSPYSVR